MLPVVVGAVATLVGVLLGGALRAWESSRARTADSKALLSALVAEIEAITRLINHRQFIPGLLQTKAKADVAIAAGRGDEPAEYLVISLKHNYFTTYEASLSKVGLLHPYWADRITRFYTFVKAVSENYDPSSPFQEGVSAHAVSDIITNDLMLLHTVVLLGNHISSEARVIEPPRGVSNPFTVTEAEGGQPPLPEPQPSLASSSAGDG